MSFLINRVEFEFLPFHDLVIQKLQDMYDGKNKKRHLVINIPVGAGKSAIVEWFITWCFAKNPQLKFLYVSHSEKLITKLSGETLDIIESKYWQDLFDRPLKQKSSVEYSFEGAGTRSGMSAAPIGSAITGVDAGNPAIPGFNGALCFEYDTLVWTNKGKIKIGDIVTKKLDVKVLSYNTHTQKTEFKEIVGYHDNGIAETMEFCGIRCTKDHRFYTQDGWKKAQDISTKDIVFSASDTLYLFKRYIQLFGNIFSFIFSVKNKLKIFFREVFFSPFVIIYRHICNMFKCFAFFDLNYGTYKEPILFCDNTYSSGIFQYSNDLFVRKIAMGTTQGPTSDSVLHIFRFGSIGKILKSVVGRIVVKMSGFYSGFLFTNESPKDKLVNSDRFTSFVVRIFEKLYIFIASSTADRFKHSAFYSVYAAVLARIRAVKTSYSAKIRDLIKVFKVGNITPYFKHWNTSLKNVYCISVKDNYSFFVSGRQVSNQSILAHNCIDDPLDAGNANSEVELNNTIYAYTNKLKTRLRSTTTPIILIMQRLSVNDLADYVLEAEAKDWDLVKVPAIDEQGRSFWESRFPAKNLLDIKARTPDLFYSQYQQEPRANAGGYYTKDMFIEAEQMPEYYTFTAIIADTAYKDGQKNDYTVFMAVGSSGGKMYILDLDYKRLKSDQVENYFMPFIKKYATRPDFIGCYIEPKGHGIYLNQHLPKLGVAIPAESTIKDFYKDRRRDKVIRMNVVLPEIAANKIYYSPTIDKMKIQEMILQCERFPNDKHDDIEDCVVDAAKLVYKYVPSILEVVD